MMDKLRKLIMALFLVPASFAFAQTTFTRIDSCAIVNDGGWSSDASWGDYDNDGFIDLFVANFFNQNNLLYRNNGDGTFTKIVAGAIVNEGGYSNGARWGDYDNDGFLDLFVVNGLDDNNFLYRNNGDGGFTKIATGAIVNDGGDSNGASWGDYDNDGFLDLFVANLGQNNFLYHNNGNGSFTKITTGAIVNDGGYSNGASWGDYDNDGFLDLFVANRGNENNFLYHNNGNGNNWINFRLVGAVSNHAGIGAKVRIKATINGASVWQMRELSGQTGNSLNAEFGLGDATRIDSMQIEWPSEIIQDTTNVNVNQFLIMREKISDSFIKADFTADLTEGNPPLTVQFMVRSVAIPPITSWHWDFDNDGVIDSQEQNPSHTFAEPGVYSVKLIVSNVSKTVIITKADFINVYQLTKITTGAIVNDGGSSQGCAWGDYDNDGFLDLFVANTFNQNNFLYRNNGDGTFTKITTGAIVNDGGSSHDASWGDYDNNGFLDLFVANIGSGLGENNFLYRNDGDGIFTKITTGAIVNDGGSSHDPSWGDYDNDGFLDLFVANDFGNNFLYRNNGDGTFTKITTGAIVDDFSSSRGASWGDYDNDGFLDLFVANYPNNFLYHNNGNGSFTKITTGAIVNDGGSSGGASWGDYDNDGFLDLFVANHPNNFLYHNNGNGSFTKITTGDIVNDSGDSFGASWGDYDNDGFLDLFVANYNQNNFLYHNNGDGSFTKITTSAIVNDGGYSVGASWGDYDNDGFLDLFVANYIGDNFLYHSNSNSNNWINLRLVGAVSNHSGIGAKVKVKAIIDGAPVWQMRELSGQTGNSLNAEFGLGDATIVDSIRVQWPNGMIQDTTNIAAKQFLNITERSFTRLTTGAIVNDFGFSVGASWGDYDNDNFLDLFVTNAYFSGEKNFLYRNNGDGTFAKITTGAIVNDVGSFHGASWGDYDNDGFLDLFVANSLDGNNFLYRNNGDGTFTKITTGEIVNDGGWSNGASWGDYDNDGFLDLFVANDGGGNFLYHNNGHSTFTKITTGVIVSEDGRSRGASWGDYDNDGFLDLFVANSLGQNNFLYRNNGDGTFSKITTGAIVNDGGYTRGASWGDYDNDGFLDLFVVKAPINFLYHNNGDGSFTKITTGDIVNDGGDFHGASWGDFDNDGFLDLFVVNSDNEYNFLYRNNGDGTFTKIAAGAIVNDGGYSQGASWGDYDNDGFLDLFVASSETNFLYRNNGNGNNWINLCLVGTGSNHFGIGAKVRVKATINGAPVSQMQELTGQTGYLSQNSLKAEFGLKKASIVDSVQIRWPSGAVNGYANVKVNQFLTLRENNRPRVQNNIPPVTLSPDSSIFVRDLNADPVVFIDRDGDTLNYATVSNKPSIVTASVSGSRLTVSLVSDTTFGQAQITVKADDGRTDDGRGDTEETTFEINRTPYILEDMTDVKLLVSDKFVKDLKQVFKDADGDNISYRASSSDTSIALPAFSETKLVIVPFDTGNAVIIVTAEDEHEGKKIIQFKVSVIISPAPEIKHAPIDTAKLGEEIPITAEITDDENAIALAVLQYRAAGAPGFISLSMRTQQENTLQTTIPGSAVTDHGVEYYIEARDIHNVPSRQPVSGVFSVRVRIDNNIGVKNTRPEPAGSEQTSYHLFSIPLDVDKDKRNPRTVLEDDLGSYDPTRWRFFDWAPGSTSREIVNVELPDIAEITPGKAFWLIIKESGKFIDTGSGTTLLTSEKYPVSLHQGWNLVGNPFNFTTVFDASSNIRQRLFIFAYQSGEFGDPVMLPIDSLKLKFTELQPFEGYAVFCDSASTLFINPDRFSTGSALRKKQIAADEKMLWSIRILAQCQNARDRNNVAAVVQGARREWDERDAPEPPVLGEYVSVYFPHPEWNKFSKNYCTDFRAESAEGDEWEFETKTNIHDVVNLSFEGIESVPEEYEVWLIDKAVKVTSDLRKKNSYAVAGRGPESPKRLTLVVGKQSYVNKKLAEYKLVPAEYELSQNFPNPFNPATTIQYGLPNPDRVTLKVYDLLGKEVATLVDNELKEAGYHAAIWGGRSTAGTVISSGVYFYRMRAGKFVQTRKMVLVE